MEDNKKKIDRKVRKFMKSVQAFLQSKNGGEIAPEWEASIVMLEEYYKMFLQLSDEINNLDSYFLLNKYSTVQHPALRARDAAAARVESLLKNLGCTFRESLKLDLSEPVVEESPLEQFVKGKVETR